MAKEPEDMILPMLREMRGEIAQRFDGVNERFDSVDTRLDKLELGQKNFRNALTADTLMSKFLIGDFEERLADLERKVNEFMNAK